MATAGKVSEFVIANAHKSGFLEPHKVVFRTSLAHAPAFIVH